MEKTMPLSELISLRGKKALITGAAVGIGKAIASRFAEAGAALELVDIDSQGLEATRKELAQFNAEINTHEADISQKKEIDSLWEELKGKGPDILVNNAGIYPFKKFLDIDETFLKKVMDVNLSSVFWMCHHMIRERGKEGGVIINIGSIEAILPFAEDMVHYSMSKAGVIALTRSLAREHGRDGFRVNVLVPGGIATPGTQAATGETARFQGGLLQTGMRLIRRLPLGRGGHPDEVARMALVLASDLSSYVQGALIPVDGGFLSA